MSLSRKWVTLGLAAAVALVLIRLVLPGGVLAQEVGWPTPPPGPGFPVPSDTAVQATVRNSVEESGAVVFTVSPSWPGPVPLIPPIPSSALVFNDASWDSLPLTVAVDAGTFDQLVQIRVSEVSGEDVPVVPGRVQLAWRIEVFNQNADRWSRPPQRPLSVSITVAALVASGIDGARLLFWLEANDELVPQLTSFDTRTLVLTTRLISPGLLVLTDDS